MLSLPFPTATMTALRLALAGAVLACHLGARAADAEGTPVVPSWTPTGLLSRVGTDGSVVTHSFRLIAEPTPQRLALDNNTHFGRGPSTRFGVEWQRNQTSRFGLDKGTRSLGIQLDSGYRMSVKVRSNGVMLTLRGQF